VTLRNDREMPHGAVSPCVGQELPPGLVGVRVEVDRGGAWDAAGRVAIRPEDARAAVEARVGAVVRYAASAGR
jgi:hypothetical protein